MRVQGFITWLNLHACTQKVMEHTNFKAKLNWRKF